MLRYEKAIRQVLISGIGRHVPELRHHGRINVFDEELVAYEHLQGTPPAQSALYYPFVTFAVEEERIAAGRKMPDLDVVRRDVTPSMNPLFAGDIYESATYPIGVKLRIEVYDELSELGMERQRVIVDKLRNYFALSATEEIDLVTGRLRGLWFALVDPRTGGVVEDPENPPPNAERLRFTVTDIGPVVKTTTTLNVARKERRRAFTVWIGGHAQFVKRVPHVQMEAEAGPVPQSTGIHIECNASSS